MVYIYRLSEIGWDKTFNRFAHTDHTSVKFSPDVIEQQGGIGATPALLTFWLGFDFVFRWMSVKLSRRTLEILSPSERALCQCVHHWAGPFEGGSILVWGGTMGGNNTHWMVINGNIYALTYLNDVLAVEVLPFIQFHGPSVTFMHDNAGPHSSAITRQFVATNIVNVLDWPANSPDLNPIE